MREADVAIRMAPPRQPELIQRHLMTVQIYVYAAPRYIERHGVPKRRRSGPARIVVYGDETRPPVPELNWLLTVGSADDQPRRRS